MIINVIGNFNIEKMHKLLKEFYGSQKPGNVNYPDLPQWSTGFEKSYLNNHIQELYHRFYKGKNIQYQIFYQLPDNSLEEYYDLLEKSLDSQSGKIKISLEEQFPKTIKSLRFSTNTSPIGNYLEAQIVLNKAADYLKLGKSLTNIFSETNFSVTKEKVESEAIKSITDFYKNTEKPHMFGIFNAGKLAEYGIESVISSYSGKNYTAANNKLKTLKISNIYTSIVEHPFLRSNRKNVIQAAAVKLFKGDNRKPTLIVKQALQSNLLAIHYLLKYKSHTNPSLERTLPNIGMMLSAKE